MRGRKPVPTPLRILRGNPRQHRLPTDEPHPDPLDIVCPPELTDAIARREWDRAIVPAIAIGQITAADRALAIAHCELWATWQSQLHEAIKHPHVIGVGKQKYPTMNPARVMANKTLQLLSSVDEKLGFTPTARSRVTGCAPSRPAHSSRLQVAQRDRFFSTDRG